MKERILIVEDELGLITMLKRILDKEGFQNIFQAQSGRQALEIIQNHELDLILLDVMLPDISGFDLCTRIRERLDLPIIFLTARTSDIDKLTGFSLGGDDYITKPFNPLEVVARIKAILYRQRKNAQDKENVFHTRRFSLHFDQAQLFVDHKPVECPAMEFQLLKFMCQHPNQVLSIEQLYENVWGDYQILGKENTVMVHISRLRKKIEEDPKNPKYLINIRGLGYLLKVDEKEEDR